MGLKVVSITNETYVPLSRGLDEHIPKLHGAPLSIYVHILIRAKHCGRDIGIYKCSIADLAHDLELTYKTIHSALKNKLNGKYLSIKPAKNQHSKTEFKVLKYKTVNDYQPKPLMKPVTEATTQATTEAREKQLHKRLHKQGDKHGQEAQENHTDTATQELKNLRTKELKKDLKDICDFWNSQNIQIHRTFDKYLPNIKSKLKLYSKEEIIEAITNYKLVLDSPEHWWTKKWTLGLFLTRDTGFENFLSINNPWENYKNKQGTEKPKPKGFQLDEKVWGKE